MTDSYHQEPGAAPPPPPPERPAKLLRSTSDQVIGGVAGGLGHYFGLDPVLVRIAFVLLVVAGGSGILLYIILWIVIPEAEGEEDVPVMRGDRRELGGLVIGGAVVLLGVFFLLRRFIPWLDSGVVWALLLIGLGAFILLRGVRR